LYDSRYLSKVKKAIKEYDMIREGDRVVAGVSGGKDSTALLYILAQLQRHSHLRFELHAVILDIGWGEVNLDGHRALCERLGVPLTVKGHPVAQIIDKHPEKNACTLCGKIRAGVLNNTALELGANRVALGHHLDDVIETYFLNLIFTGQMKTFLPNTYLSNTDLHLIRPLVFLPEHVLVSLARREELPVVTNPCPHNGHTRRDEAKAIVSDLAVRYPDFRDKFLSALHNVSLENLWKQR
jgi:tRNA(Ile)-lysidine synthase TilS/MesJ